MVKKQKFSVKSFLKREEGVSIIIAAFSLTFILGLTALVIDLGIAYYNKAKLQATCDACALAVAQVMNNDGDEIKYSLTGEFLSSDAGYQKVARVCKQTFLENYPKLVAAGLTRADIKDISYSEPGKFYYVYKGKTYYLTMTLKDIKQIGANQYYKKVVVYADDYSPTTFAKLMGFEYVKVSADAAAEQGKTKPDTIFSHGMYSIEKFAFKGTPHLGPGTVAGSDGDVDVGWNYTTLDEGAKITAAGQVTGIGNIQNFSPDMIVENSGEVWGTAHDDSFTAWYNKIMSNEYSNRNNFEASVQAATNNTTTLSKNSYFSAGRSTPYSKDSGNPEEFGYYNFGMWGLVPFGASYTAGGQTCGYSLNGVHNYNALNSAYTQSDYIDETYSTVHDYAYGSNMPANTWNLGEYCVYFKGDLKVSADLYIDGNLYVNQKLTIAANATVYVTGDVYVGSSAQVNGKLIAKKNIAITGGSFGGSASSPALIYSAEGNIFTGQAGSEFKGVVYAPGKLRADGTVDPSTGKVSLTGGSTVYNGAIVANKLEDVGSAGLNVNYNSDYIPWLTGKDRLMLVE